MDHVSSENLEDCSDLCKECSGICPRRCKPCCVCLSLCFLIASIVYGVIEIVKAS